MPELTAEQRANTPCYIGRTTEPTINHPITGTVVCASVDEDSRVAQNAKTVAKWMRGGLTVERVPVWWVRLHLETAEIYRPGDSPPVAERAA